MCSVQNQYTHTGNAKSSVLGITLFCLIFFTSYTSFSQNNNWQTTGNNVDTSAFVGTTNSEDLRFKTNNIEHLRISKTGKIGIGTSMPKTALDVEGRIQLTDDLILKKHANLQDTIYRFLMIDKGGTTQPVGPNLVKAVMGIDDCFYIPLTFHPPGFNDPIVAGHYSDWGKRIQGMKSILYTGSGCSAWVGIGTELPMTKLDVRGAGRFTRGVKVGNETGINAGLYIENHGSAMSPAFDQLILVKNEAGRKVLQLEDSGLLRAREVKVDEKNWADYVFQKNYPLMPLNEVKSFIEKHGHLPNVPSAVEIKEEGLSLGEAAKTSMEKIEELTLYLLEINEKVESQEAVLEEQQNLLQQQKETIRLQQELIEELKQQTIKK